MFYFTYLGGWIGLQEKVELKSHPKDKIGDVTAIGAEITKFLDSLLEQFRILLDHIK